MYAENLLALETVRRLVDGILEDTSPLLQLPEDPKRQIRRLREVKVTLDILAQVLLRASQGHLERGDAPVA